MRRMLQEIQEGSYARKWIAENEAGRPWFNQQRAKEQQHSIEIVGERLRALMPFLKPVTVPGSKIEPAAESKEEAATVAS